MLSKLNRSPVGAETFGAKFIQFLIFNSDIGGSGFQRKRYIYIYIFACNNRSEHNLVECAGLTELIYLRGTKVVKLTLRVSRKLSV